MSPPPVLFKRMAFEGAPPAAAPAPEVPPLALATVKTRFLAATIDVLVLVAVLVILAAWLGTIDTSHGLVVEVQGAAALVWIVAVCAYPALVEIFTARSLGKVLFGLRVVRIEDGARPSTWALAARTALRLVDGLPCFYLFGAVFVLGTSSRQRLGDLAARTVVVRDRP